MPFERVERTVFDGTQALRWEQIAEIGSRIERGELLISKRCPHTGEADVDRGLVYGIEMAKPGDAEPFVFLCCASCRDHVLKCKGERARLVHAPDSREAERRARPCSNCHATGFTQHPEICGICRGTGIEPVQSV